MTIFSADSFMGWVLHAAWVEFDELGLASWAWWVGSDKMSWAWRVGHDELDLTRDTCHMSWVGADELGMMGLRAWWVEFDELGLARDTWYMPHVKWYMIHDTWVGSACWIWQVVFVWFVVFGKLDSARQLLHVPELDLACCAWWVGFSRSCWVWQVMLCELGLANRIWQVVLGELGLAGCFWQVWHAAWCLLCFMYFGLSKIGKFMTAYKYSMCWCLCLDVLLSIFSLTSLN